MLTPGEEIKIGEFTCTVKEVYNRDAYGQIIEENKKYYLFSLNTPNDNIYKQFSLTKQDLGDVIKENVSGNPGIFPYVSSLEKLTKIYDFLKKKEKNLLQTVDSPFEFNKWYSSPTWTLIKAVKIIKRKENIFYYNEIIRDEYKHLDIMSEFYLSDNFLTNNLIYTDQAILDKYLPEGHPDKSLVSNSSINLEGRYVKVIDDSAIKHYPCRNGDYMLFNHMKGNCQYWGEHGKRSNYFSANVHIDPRFELMPEGFTPSSLLPVTEKTPEKDISPVMSYTPETVIFNSMPWTPDKCFKKSSRPNIELLEPILIKKRKLI